MMKDLETDKLKFEQSLLSSKVTCTEAVIQTLEARVRSPGYRIVVVNHHVPYMQIFCSKEIVISTKLVKVLLEVQEILAPEFFDVLLTELLEHEFHKLKSGDHGVSLEKLRPYFLGVLMDSAHSKSKLKPNFKKLGQKLKIFGNLVVDLSANQVLNSEYKHLKVTEHKRTHITSLRYSTKKEVRMEQGIFDEKLLYTQYFLHPYTPFKFDSKFSIRDTFFRKKLKSQELLFGETVRVRYEYHYKTQARVGLKAVCKQVFDNNGKEIGYFKVEIENSDPFEANSKISGISSESSFLETLIFIPLPLRLLTLVSKMERDGSSVFLYKLCGEAKVTLLTASVL